MDCDVAVLGGGPGGYTAAIRAAQLGAKAVCIEKEPELGRHLPARRAASRRRRGCRRRSRSRRPRRPSRKLGVQVGEPQLDFGTANQWKDGVVKQMTGGVASLFKANGVEWVKGTGRFKDANTIAVEGGEDVQFRSAIVATGSFPLRPPIPGLDSPRCVDSTGLLAQTEVPRRLVVLGGGIIGCEFASIFRRFGSEVTIIEMLPKLIPAEDDDASKELAKQFEKRGIALHLEKQCTGVEDTGGGLRVHFGDGETRRGRPDARLGRPRRRWSRGSGSRRSASSSTSARASPPTSTGGRPSSTSTPSATAPATGSSRTRPSARARSRPRTPWATRRSSTTAASRGRSTPTRRSPASG